MREFGVCSPGLPVLERQAAYALALSPEGRLAVIDKPEGLFLPGGGIDPGESQEEALRREVLAGIGHSLTLLGKVCEAVQWDSSASHANCVKKIGHFYQTLLGDLWQAPAERGHRLLWMPRLEARSCLTQHFQAWAVSQVARG